jgi:hypothetical protein
MNKVKLILLASAAAMLIGTGDADARVSFFAGSSPTLCMPARTVAAGHALSPYAVATRLSAKRYKVQSMHRHGSAYAVRAIGPHGSKVDMMVDGGSGAIIGLTVLAAATGNIISAMTAQNAVYVDDLHPFGAVVPEVVYDSWDSIGESSWQVASAETIAVPETYAAYQMAVPFNFVHMSRNGRSVALAPPRYRGFRLTNSRGQAIHSRMTRSDAAYEEAAYQSERVDQAEFDKEMAQEDAADANEQADQLQQQNDALSDAVDAQTQHADEVEQQNAALQQQLDQNGTANQDVDGGGGDSCGPSAPTCAGQTNPYYDGSDQGGAADSNDSGGDTADNATTADDQGGAAQDTAAAPDDNGGGQTDTAEDRVPAGADSAAPADQGGAAEPEEQPAPMEAAPAETGGADQQEQSAPDAAQQDAAPQDQGAEQQEQAPAQEEAAPADSGGDDQQAAPDDSGGGGDMNSGGGGGDDSGGGGDDGN